MTVYVEDDLLRASVSVSIAKRLQDPLAELVKIEPRHIGVGMYQVCLLKETLILIFHICL